VFSLIAALEGTIFTLANQHIFHEFKTPPILFSRVLTLQIILGLLITLGMVLVVLGGRERCHGNLGESCENSGLKRIPLFCLYFFVFVFDNPVCCSIEAHAIVKRY
jgi:hypothetical protein